jgi:hypothetical protein
MQIESLVKRQIDHLSRDQIYNPISTQFDTAGQTLRQMDSNQALWGRVFGQLEQDLGEFLAN